MADQIYALEPEYVVEDEEFVAESKRHAQYALNNPHSGTPWEVVQEGLLGQQHATQEEK